MMRIEIKHTDSELIYISKYWFQKSLDEIDLMKIHPASDVALFK